MASSSTKLSLKLLIDTKRDKVLFAEASKAVIDFLFNLLCLPVSTVIRLLKKDGMVGSLGSLYESVESLNETYMQPFQDKNVLLKPTTPISSTEISGLLPPNDYSADHDNLEITNSFYTCSGQGPGNYCDNCGDHIDRCNYVTGDNNTPCPQCQNTMNEELHYVGRNVAKEKFPKSGFVIETVTYMVMDDLVVQPMSSISSISLLNKFNIKEVGVLKERVVELGMDEGVNLLKASLQSKTVLTTVFLKKNMGS